MTLQIFIARHGQNIDNVNGILNGHRDLPLTDLGRQQASELGDSIKEMGLSFDAIYTSPLIRAHETAEIVANISDSPTPIVYDGLIERDFGSMTGKPIDSIEELCGDDVVRTDTITYFVAPEGAETFPELVTRGQSVLDHVRKLHSDGNVLLVCHGDIGKMIYCAETKKDWRDVLSGFHFGNGELIDISGVGEVHMVKLAQHNL